jgi:hypothetical protein
MTETDAMVFVVEILQQGDIYLDEICRRRPFNACCENEVS